MSKTAVPTVLPPRTITRPAAAFPNVKKAALFVLGALVAAVLCYVAAQKVAYAMGHEETDDAEVAGDVSPVLPRVSGYVTRVLVTDNQHVVAGQPLVEIDARELDLKVATAEANLEGAEAALKSAQAGLADAHAALAVAQAQAEVAAVKDAKAASDLRRDDALFRNKAISDQEWSDSQAAAAVGRAEHAAADREVDAARTKLAALQAGIASAQAQVAAARASVNFAALQRSYAVVAAPIAGVVSGKSVEPGELVQSGQTLLSIASDQDAWVIANFKETQLARMHRGQPADFTVDGYPGVVFHGRIDSIAAATGARFALLPPDNATGNFVKVTQRVPVKIVLDGPAPDGRVLRQGMSVDASVAVGG